MRRALTGLLNEGWNLAATSGKMVGAADDAISYYGSSD